MAAYRVTAPPQFPDLSTTEKPGPPDAASRHETVASPAKFFEAVGDMGVERNSPIVNRDCESTTTFGGRHRPVHEQRRIVSCPRQAG